MSGDVAFEDDVRGRPGGRRAPPPRARFNAELIDSERWLGAVLPVGDGIGIAARTGP